MKFEQFLAYVATHGERLQREERQAREAAEDRYYAELGDLIERHPLYNPTRVPGRSNHLYRGNDYQTTT